MGQPTYLEAKAEGDNSMSVKRLRSESVVGPVPQDPRDTLKAELLEPQSPWRYLQKVCNQSGGVPSL